MNKKVIICVNARVNSKRLPRKALLKINGIETIRYLIRRLKTSKYNDTIVLCTSNDNDDKPLIQIAKDENIFYKEGIGTQSDVMGRYNSAAKLLNADVIVRITGDDILIDTDLMDKMIEDHIFKNADYTLSLAQIRGTDSEIISYYALTRAYQELKDKNKSEYMRDYLYHRDIYNVNDYNIDNDIIRNDINLSIDYYSDFIFVSKVLIYEKHVGRFLTTKEIIKFCDRNNIDTVKT